MAQARAKAREATGAQYGEGAGTWRTLLTVSAVAVTLAAGAWWWQTQQWPIEVVRIDGELIRTDRARLKAVVGRHTDAGWASVDLTALQRDVEALPWVAQASLRRVWPDTLTVKVAERHAVAVWNGDALIGADGVIFRPQRVPGDGLVRLRGPAGQGKAMLERLRRFETQLAPLGLGIAALDQDARRAWRVTLDNDVVLRLGRAHINARLARLQAVWPAVLAGKAGRIEAVDLRYTNGFAVAWAGEGGAANDG